MNCDVSDTTIPRGLQSSLAQIWKELEEGKFYFEHFKNAVQTFFISKSLLAKNIDYIDVYGWVRHNVLLSSKLITNRLWPVDCVFDGTYELVYY